VVIRKGLSQGKKIFRNGQNYNEIRGINASGGGKKVFI
jgi:hypothetical protein